MQNNNSKLAKLKKLVVPSLITAGAGIGLFYVFVSSDILEAKLPFANIELPAPLALGGSLFLGNMLGELTSEVILPKLKFGNPKLESMIIPPVTTGAANALITKVMISENVDLTKPFILGSGASIVGNYIYNSIY